MNTHTSFPSFFPLSLRGRVAAFLVLLSLVLVGGGCSATKQERQPPLPHSLTADPPAGSSMLTANTYAGDAIAAMLLQRTGSGSAILSTSMARMDNLNESSSFGRISMQQVASRVAQHGFKIVDVRLSDTLRVNERGEFMLTRDTARLLSQQYEAHAVLTGVYTQSGNRVFVSVRALRLSDSAVIAAYEYYLPLNGDTQFLLSNSGGGSGGSAAASGDAIWSRYATRGQASTCPETAATRSAIPAGSVAAKASSGTRSSGRKSRPQAVAAPRPAPQPVYASGGGCGNSGGQMTPFGEEFVDRGGGKWIDPNAVPAPIPGRR